MVFYRLKSQTVGLMSEEIAEGYKYLLTENARRKTFSKGIF
jgi:hypothetical protein